MSEQNRRMEHERLGSINHAMGLCREDAKGRLGVSGKIGCPSCGTALRYAVSVTNGCIWGKCETGGCLEWIEQGESEGCHTRCIKSTTETGSPM